MASDFAFLRLFLSLYVIFASFLMSSAPLNASPFFPVAVGIDVSFVYPSPITFFFIVSRTRHFHAFLAPIVAPTPSDCCSSNARCRRPADSKAKCLYLASQSVIWFSRRGADVVNFDLNMLCVFAFPLARAAPKPSFPFSSPLSSLCFTFDSFTTV